MKPNATGRTLSAVRNYNRSLVLSVIWQRGSLSRADIARATGITPPAVSSLVKELSDLGLVEELGIGDSTLAGGRKPTLFRINPAGGFAVGLKLGLDELSVTSIDLLGGVLDHFSRPRDPNEGEGRVLARVSDLIQEALQRSTRMSHSLLGIGLALPGIVDSRAGVLRYSHLLGWRDVPVQYLLGKEFGVPVFVDNDVNALTLGERMYGAARGVDNVLCVTVGTGIGAGVVLNGQILSGSHHGAGELGHSTIMLDGPVCRCGKSGCLEALASDSGIVRQATTRLEKGQHSVLLEMTGGKTDQITADLVSKAAKEGDQLAKEVLEQTARYLGLAIASAFNLIDPDLVLVGGERMERSGHLMLDAIVEAARENTFSTMKDNVRIARTALGERAWTVGAATLVLQHLFRPSSTGGLFAEMMDRASTPRTFGGKRKLGV